MVREPCATCAEKRRRPGSIFASGAKVCRQRNRRHLWFLTDCMPIKKRKLASGRVRVTGPGGEVLSKGTTSAKAASQERLLNMIKNGITPKGGWRNR